MQSERFITSNPFYYLEFVSVWIVSTEDGIQGVQINPGPDIGDPAVRRAHLKSASFFAAKADCSNEDVLVPRHEGHRAATVTLH